MSSQLQGSNAITMALGSAGLAIGSTTSQISIGTSIVVSIVGRAVSRGTIASQALVAEPGMQPDPLNKSAFKTLPAGMTCAFSVYVDTAGAVTIGQGDFVENGSLAPVREAPGGKAIIGAVKVVNNTLTANGGFRPGTDAFNNGAVTTSYINLTQHPGAGV
jgi:hypothetical protein